MADAFDRLVEQVGVVKDQVGSANGDGVLVPEVSDGGKGDRIADAK
ncbi:hypothetical protein [Leptolyngbya sp. 7M]|nr:hypothetical protein [Leptolyngbya sp. 7M]